MGTVPTTFGATRIHSLIPFSGSFKCSKTSVTVRKIKIFITGIAGALGSQLAGEFLERGHTVEGCDIKRRHEAHKLDDIMEDIKYIWSGQEDLKENISWMWM